jgi:hypothetical protein
MPQTEPPQGTRCSGKAQAAAFNQDCRCVTLDRDALLREPPENSNNSLLKQLLIERPQLFAASPVFVSEYCLNRQSEIIEAIDTVLRLPSYQQHVFAYAPTAARFEPQALGVFTSYDFHLAADGPRLIEINSNAGGGLLNVLLDRAQTGACQGVQSVADWLGVADVEAEFWAMFLAEWRAERGDASWKTVAIVDEQPQNQFLFPEFLLFQRLFEWQGLTAVICDPGELSWDGQALRHGDLAIDFVYNRLTDFGLAEPAHAAVREAYLANAVVLSPHPRTHAIYADKRNLALLTDEAALREIGVNEHTRTTLLGGIAKTFPVRQEEAETLWQGRKKLFFKPVAGYGSKGAYRGDKLTRRVFEDIMQGGYVAQALVSPSERLLSVEGALTPLKFDLRVYAYRTRVQWVAARLYQGQTTNFRTPGGGFAPVAVVPCKEP